MKILIGTPAYGGMVHLEYMNSVLDYQKHGLNFTLASFGNESLITRARNSIISFFYHHRDDFTHLLFLDADIRLPARDLKTLLDFGKDVVGAPVPVKAYSSDGSVRANSTGPMEQIAPHLFKTKQLSTAALLLSKRAVVAVVEKAIEAQRVYRNPVGHDSKGNLDNMEMYDVFRVGIVDEEYLSEDYWLCMELRELGFDICLTDAVKIVHHGMHGFSLKSRASKTGEPG